MRFSLFLILILLNSACKQTCSPPAKNSKIIISGPTMGTNYKIVIISSKKINKIKLKNQINNNLNKISKIFSTYIPNSTISKFNNLNSQEKIKIEPEFSFVLSHALEFHKITQGVFNIALDPIINLWGFDKDGRITQKPNHEKIIKNLENINLNNLVLNNNKIFKKNNNLKINLSSIAKGWAVDNLAEFLLEQNIKNFLIEIGGETKAVGDKSQNKNWIIAIENPQFPKNLENNLFLVKLKNLALATSGTYLNFFVYKNKNYSHIINPLTGYPVKTNIVSVSIIAPDCMTADALATAALILGEEKTREIIKNFPNTGALFVKIINNNIHTSMTQYFAQQIL